MDFVNELLRHYTNCTAKEWSQYANFKLAFGAGPEAEIRISFQQENSWSYIGTESLVVSANEPTMNFGWLQADTPDGEMPG